MPKLRQAVRWCYFGEALALEEQGRHREALELVRLARLGAFANPLMAAAEIRLRSVLGEDDRAEANGIRLAERHPRAPRGLIDLGRFAGQEVRI